ncbi:hypothetical protein ACIA8K_07000 [Catenuloplanes sp. NPDC051500]|uniref:hypothetical protein n=1 Tax=Catenuloplanes sp. NPDC051500 TaxID=3363959 RepID=UPI00378EDF85
MTGVIADTAHAVLVAHQRRDAGSCLCGFSELGRSHPGHQVAMLAEAGLLAAEPESVACPDHRPVQHRDRKPPWCRTCGRDTEGRLIGRPKTGDPT